jgi:hypothetical protein
MSKINSNQYVRFYFQLDLKCLIPPNPVVSGKTDKQWERDRIEVLESDLQVLMEGKGVDLAYKDHRCDDVTHRLFCVHFIVAALREVQPAQMAGIEKRYGTFRIRKRSLSKILRDIETQIMEILGRRACIVAKFEYLYSTRRNFVFEIYMEGDLEVEYSLSNKDIADAGGSVRDAIEYFNSQVVDCCEAANINAWPSSSSLRRPADNIFKYELMATEHYCFPENAVLGNMAMMFKDMPLLDAVALGIDCNDQEMIDYIAGTREYAECNQLIDLPNKAILRKFTLDFTDYDGDLYDYDDEMP